MNRIHILLVLALLMTAGCAYSHRIERDTFHVTLPKNWTEDLEAESYNPSRHVFFENPESESCIISVQIWDNDVGISLDYVFEEFLKLLKKRIMPISESAFVEWGNYRGKGAWIQGMMRGAYPAHARLFSFEADGRIIVIMESALDEDWTAYRRDFVLFRNTFRTLNVNNQEANNEMQPTK